MNILNCFYCKKEYSYKKKGEYERHIILCELISESNKKKYDEEDEEDVPSNVELYKIIKELSIQNKKLSDKVNLLEKMIQRGTSLKKVDILDRLKLFNPLETYNEWIRSIEITEEDIESLITDTIPQVISTIISRNIAERSSTDILPIISSDLKKSMIYIYDVNYTTHLSPSSSPEQSGYISSSPEWMKMEPEHYMKLIPTFYQNLYKTFKTKWTKTNKGFRYMFDEIESKIIEKLTSIDIENANNTTNRKIWQSLYSLVSKEI
jgi:hypothetical protein